MKKILVLCTGNSCRSQIAEGYLRHFANGKAAIFSAGIETHGVNPKAVKVMALDGIDISGHTSDNVAEYEHLSFDYVITVCDNASENCPFFAGKAQRFHHNFRDPAKAAGNEEDVLKAFISVRNEIREYARAFAAQRLM